MKFDKLSLDLFEAQNECTLSWITCDSSPAATIVSYLLHDDTLWMTALASSARVRAIDRDKRVSVVVSGMGTTVGEARCLAMRGDCFVHDDQANRDWFFPALGKRVLPNSETGAAMMAASMNNSANLILQFVPKKLFPYDAQKMMRMADRA